MAALAASSSAPVLPSAGRPRTSLSATAPGRSPKTTMWSQKHSGAGIAEGFDGARTMPGGFHSASSAGGFRNSMPAGGFRTTVPAPILSHHVPWKQFHVTVRPGTKTLLDRLVDRERDRCPDEELRQLGFRRLKRTVSSSVLVATLASTVPKPHPQQLMGLRPSPRAESMLSETRRVTREFTPAPLQDHRSMTDTGTKGGNSPKAGGAGKIVFQNWRPTAKPSLSITKGSRLAELIENGCIGVVRSSYFEDCMLHHRPFAMRQLIPNTFMWRGDEAVRLWWKHGKCFLCNVSYAWLSKEHPDPKQLHLSRFVRILEEYKKMWNMQEVGVILDYCSLFQRTARGDTRAPEQKEQFELGFREINSAYSHKAVTSIKLMDVPASEPRKYDDRGWTFMESILIDSKGGDWNRWTFGALDPDSQQWGDPIVFFMQAKATKLCPPLVPDAFIRELEQRKRMLRDRDLPLFANEQDSDEVPSRYAEIFSELVRATSLVYDSADWADDEVHLLAEVLLKCDRLESLQLNNNRIHIAGASRLANLIPQLPMLRSLGLKGNPLCQDRQATELLKFVWTRESKPIRNLVL
mmetsp:Transcript_27164/g.78038  ORF Transcript_27164/g.78038 Transcript_27164/m.78038 type:complete len:579 (-) Transcript_27164:130-1866(-)